MKKITIIGKKHALKKYDQFALNTSCFWGSTRSNITLVVQFHKNFVTKIINKLIYYYCCSKNFVKSDNSVLQKPGSKKIKSWCWWPIIGAEVVYHNTRLFLLLTFFKIILSKKLLTTSKMVKFGSESVPTAWRRRFLEATEAS